QSSSTLSGGEAQRLKLAAYLSDDKKLNEKTLFIFDEPSSGLHNKDISYFMTSVFRLIDSGNSVIIIEHNTELIKQADWLIDMGPDGGDGGGLVCFKGTPQNLIKLKNNKTAKYLKREFVI
ncbi:MAG: excinuclease ABC subunit A, partial [Bacteroidota bacterium]|nr:excinuclease ABC subunit A [Bacteroidota bacterium]